MRNTVSAVMTAALTLLTLASQARSETRIGEATAVARNTLLQKQGAKRPIERGDPVAADNTIMTDAAGRAAFRFVDDTRLSVGPNSSVRLDKFVFDGATSPSSFVIRATKGLLRFSTGRGDHEAYRIQTPAATIGVRGTQFDVKIQGSDVRVSVTDGEVVLCPNRGRPGFADCVECKAGFSILSGRTRARVVPTSSLPQIRADALLPLPTLASLPTALPGAVRQAAGVVGGATQPIAGAAGAATGVAGQGVGAAGNVAGGVIGGINGAVGGVVGGINGTVGGLGGGLGSGLGRVLGGIRLGR